MDLTKGRRLSESDVNIVWRRYTHNKPALEAATPDDDNDFWTIAELTCVPPPGCKRTQLAHQPACCPAFDPRGACLPTRLARCPPTASSSSSCAHGTTTTPPSRASISTGGCECSTARAGARCGDRARCWTARCRRPRPIAAAQISKAQFKLFLWGPNYLRDEPNPDHVRLPRVGPDRAGPAHASRRPRRAGGAPRQVPRRAVELLQQRGPHGSGMHGQEQRRPFPRRVRAPRGIANRQRPPLAHCAALPLSSFAPGSTRAPGWRWASIGPTLARKTIPRRPSSSSAASLAPSSACTTAWSPCSGTSRTARRGPTTGAETASSTSASSRRGRRTSSGALC